MATNAPNEREGEEKIDSMQLEFTYLLTSQMETQREYFEEKLNRLESVFTADRQMLLKETESLKKSNVLMEQKLQNLSKEKQALEKKLSITNAR